jgi:hypothetical protein
MRKLQQARYIATYVRSGKVLDLHNENRVVVFPCALHGGKNQQARASHLFLFPPGADLCPAIADTCITPTRGLTIANLFSVTVTTVVGFPPLRCRFHNQ